MNKVLTVAVVTLTALTMSACSGDDARPTESATPSPTVPDVGSTPVFTEAPDHEDKETPAPAPTAAETSDVAAAEIGALYFDTLTDETLERSEWLRILKPLTTDEHYRHWLAGYEGPDADIDGEWYSYYGDRAGAVVVERTDGASVIHVEIQTDDHTVTLVLVRPTAESNWLVNEIL